MIESQPPSSDPSIVALIPARSGSKRVPGKNIRRLGNHPLIAYTIVSALDSGVFRDVIVSTDSEQIAEVARHYGAEVPFLRPQELSGDKSRDIEWVEDLLGKLRSDGRDYDCFSLLRPTSPMRTASTIQRAWVAFLDETGVDSLRAVETVRQHPGKMWVVRGRRMSPLLPYGPAEQPWHSSQYQSLPVIHVQNASLEIAWTRVVFEGRTIAGEVVMPFLTEGDEGLDINDAEDWMLAEQLVMQENVLLPQVSVDRFEPK
jgi:N-acylneuraminate cytidylyltransferase